MLCNVSALFLRCTLFQHTLMVSRLRSVCHLDLGISDSVKRSSDSWSGVVYGGKLSQSGLCVSSSPTSSSPSAAGSSTASRLASLNAPSGTSENCARFAHRCIPTESTWQVARKSDVGEKATPVATLAILNASTSCPVGRSYVLITASCEVVMSHLESGESAKSSTRAVALSSRTTRRVSTSTILTAFPSRGATASRLFSRWR